MNEFVEIKANAFSIVMRKPLYEIGINDADYMVYSRVNGERTKCPYYVAWSNMMVRAYCSEFKTKNPAYIDVIVCDEWHLFSVFKTWMATQDWEDKQLDKDILYPLNKVYSPTTCCFVDRKINTLFVGHRSNRILPKGIYMIKRSKKYITRIRINGKSRHIGYFKQLNDAVSAYNTEKVKHIKSLFIGLDDNIVDGLKRHISLLERNITPL